MGHYTVDAPHTGDIWECTGVKVIPVNLGGIHGRGLAKQAYDKGLIKYRVHNRFENSPWRKPQEVVCVAVKGAAPDTAKVKGAAYSERVTGGNLVLLEEELAHLEAYARGEVDVDTQIWVPFIGLGFGEGDPRDILPLLRKLDHLANVNFIRAGESAFGRYAGSFAPGVRRDRKIISTPH